MPRAVNGMKECSKCRVTKGVSEFSKNKLRSDRLQSQCKSCLAIYRKERYDNDPEFREQMLARKKERWANDPDYRERKNAQSKARNKERYASDPEFREHLSTRRKERYANDSEYRECVIARSVARKKARYASDPEFRERVIARQKEYYANDPEYRERGAAQKNARVQAMPAAVYKIVNTITGKIYIGSTTALPRRWSQHKSRLARGTHRNPTLQVDHDKYGIEAFDCQVIQEYPHDTPVGDRQLLEHEQRVINEYIDGNKEVYNEQTVIILEQKQE